MERAYRFRIVDGFTPQTFPMERLVDYVAAFAKLLGAMESVHFQSIEPGSAVLVASVDVPARTKVRDRLVALRDGRGPPDAQTVLGELDQMLRRDNATATVSSESGDVVITFPGRDRPEPLIHGPFRQDGTIDGQLIRVGGKDETVPVRLRDGTIIHTGLVCNPEIARRIAPHIYGPILRVHGSGTWFRTGTGEWQLRSFRISDFEVLDDAPLLTVVDDLRKIEGSDWSQLPDPVITLLAERHGDEGAY